MTLVKLTLACLIAAAPLAAQERPKVPKDSIQVTVKGCLKGRVLAASDVRQTDVESGPVIRSRSFRLAGKKDVMAEVKKYDAQLVEVVGLIRKSALVEPGMRIKGGRVVIGGGSTASGTRGIPSPVENVVVLDVWNVQQAGGTCR